MKQKKLFSLALLSVLALCFVFYSCKKDKDTSPIVSVSPEPLYYYGNVGDLITFKVTVSSEIALSKVTITSTVDNETPNIALDSSVSSIGTTFNFYFRIPANLAGKSVVFDFKAENSKGKTGGTAKRLYVAAAAASQAIVLTETAGHLMYSNTSVNHDAYNLETNSGEFSLTADTASRDIQDYSGTNTTLSKEWRSPAGGKFVLYNGFDYANATDSTAISAYTTGVKYSVLYNLAVGDIIITKLGSVSTNKYAVIRITDIVDVAGKDNDYYEFKIKK
ncbi:MAG: hypothetical protein IPH32_03015 [Bacteroidetes bacterium]|nr:hypothetical protein [Bacteroidota bacterium]